MVILVLQSYLMNSQNILQYFMLNIYGTRSNVKDENNSSEKE